MRKLASIVTIDDCKPIENSDRLSVATMRGKAWEVVTGRDEFKSGDRAVYFEIDSALPSDDERYAFLHERCLKKFMRGGEVALSVVRIKTVKLRGVVSQGLLMPISSFPEADGLEDGADLTETLNVKHIDEVSMPFVKAFVADKETAGLFPSFIPKTDEERIQNLADYFEIESFKRKSFEVTEKNDGSSMTVFYSPSNRPDNPFGVCSRNLEKKIDGGSTFAAVVAKYDIAAKVKAYCDETGSELAFQGELVGPGVNGNRDSYNDHEWHIFRIWDIKAQKFLMPKERRELCKKLGFEHVHVVSEDMKVFSEYRTCKDLLLFAEGKTIRGNEREGLVFKENSETPITFKAVSNRYLLKLKD